MPFHLVVQKIKDLLENRQIKYDYFEHEPVRTSEEASKVRSGYTLKQGAKALIVKLYLKNGGQVDASIKENKGQKAQNSREKFVMLVVPGDARFDGKKVKKLFDAKDLRFATEQEVEQVTGGVLVGGVPPFGSLFNLETYVDPQVAQNNKIIFNAGDRRVSIALSVSDYFRAEEPKEASLI